MLLQRLVNDEDVGFNYDYMGAAEYEYGATRNGRMAIARLFLDGKMCARRVQFQEKHGRTTEQAITVLALGSAETLDKLGNPMVISTTKEAFRTHSSKIAGWLHVGHSDNVEPLMLLRLDAPGQEVTERVQAFLKDPIDALK